MLKTISSKTAVFAGVAVFAGLAINLELTTEAFARIKGPALDSASIECLRLQNRADYLIAQYKDAPNDQRDAILQEARNVGRDWIAVGCQAAYGNITMVVLTPHGLRNGITIDRLVVLPDAPAGQTTHKPSAMPTTPTSGIVIY
jgi:hypothetical protein